jgi:hypothetical protein
MSKILIEQKHKNRVWTKDNQPELIIDDYGNKEWWLNGRLHREDGPAIEDTDGYKAWVFKGEYHRADGPAIEHINGEKEWYLNGNYCFNKEQWFSKLTPEQQYNYLWNIDE